jgi:galactose mutarotase-like enzyme
MPASLGFHPAFRWPLPYGAARDAHDIQFAFAEPAPIRRLDDNGLVLPTTQPSPVRDRQLLLDDALFAQDVVIFDRLVSRQLSYGAPESPRLLISFAAATHLGLWTRPGAPFICIEPWRGVADPVGFDEEFERKPGLFRVPPGDSRSLAMQIESSDSGE